jgi:hypothetical protein
VAADSGFAAFIPVKAAVEMTCSVGSSLYKALELLEAEDYGVTIDIYA